MDARIAAGKQVILIAPEAAMKFLLVCQIMVDGKTPIRLPDRQDTDMRKAIIEEPRQTRGRDELQKASRNGAKARGRNLVAGPLLTGRGRGAAGGGDKTLRNKNGDLDALPIHVAAEIASHLRGSWHRVSTLVLNVLAKPVGAKVKERFISSVV